MDSAVAIADELHEAILDRFPTTATLIGEPGRDHLLPDFSSRADADFACVLGEIAERAEALDVAGLSRTDRITRSIVLQRIDALLASMEACWVEFTVSDLILTPVPGLLLTLSTTAVATEDHEQRLRGLPQFFETLASRHRAGIAAGRLPIAHLVEAAIAHLDTHPEIAALRQYREVLATEVLPHGRDTEHAGLCWLPDGARHYAAAVREHTTTDLSAEELHRIGLEVIDCLAEEYAEVGSRVFGTRELPEIFARLRDDPDLRYRDGGEMLADAERTVRRAEAAAPRWFRTVPSTACVVSAYPASPAPATPPSYLVGALDGSRPGTYFVNTQRPADTPRYLAQVTAFHEAVPGHHFEATSRLERTGLPRLRRIGGVSVFCEGWALYAERLADEMGLHSDDLDRLGMLVMDSTRAGRLVADTGSHALGWSRRQAVEYPTQATPMAASLVESEVDRYLSQPGQALAYLVGRLEIQRLRAEAERALGDAFDLAELVADWIARLVSGAPVGNSP